MNEVVTPNSPVRARSNRLVSELQNMLAFLNEKFEKVHRPLMIYRLMKEYKTITGSLSSADCLTHRIIRYRSKIFERTDMDISTKVRQLFALGAPLNTDLIKELEKDAIIEVDGKKRITKYIANDGSLKFEGRHARKTKTKEVGNARERREKLNEDEDDGGGESSGTKVEKKSMDSTNKSKALPSRKILNSGFHEESTNTTVNTGKTSIPTLDRNPSKSVTSSSIIENQLNQNLGSNKDKELTPIEHRIEVKQEPDLVDSEIKPTISSHNLGHSMNVSYEKASKLEKDISPETHRKFLESIQDMILTLELPIQNDVQKKIEQTIEKINERTKTTVSEIHTAVNSCLLIASKCEESEDDEESISLRNFLLFLRNSIISIKVADLNNFQEKLKETIGKLSIHDKKVPIKKIQSAMCTIIDIVAP